MKTIAIQKKASIQNVRMLTMTAVLSAIAFVLACLLASIVMGIVAAIVNYFILLPVFEAFMPLDQLITSFGEFIPFIKTKFDVVLFNAFPFNLLKGIGISIVTMLLYKRITPVLKGSQE